MRGTSIVASATAIVNAANTHTPVRREISLASLCAEPSLLQLYFNKFLTNTSGLSCPSTPNLHLVRKAHSAQSERNMSATVFLAFCILGCDFLLYFLFQWTYGEKCRGLSRRSNRPKSGMNQPDPRPFLVSSRRSATGVQRVQMMRQGTAKEEDGDQSQFSEVRAYRRIAASFAQAKR